MPAVTGSNVKEIAPALGVKMIQVITPDTADNADTVDVDLRTFGCTRISGILGFQQGTTGSVVTTEAPTTAVSNGVLTITIGGATANKARTFIVWAY